MSAELRPIDSHRDDTESSDRPAPLPPKRIRDRLTSAALPRGFKEIEDMDRPPILIPDGSAKVDLNEKVLETDSRRFTVESIEADFQAEQERLNSPLSRTEASHSMEKVQLELELQRSELIAGTRYKIAPEEANNAVIQTMTTELAAVSIVRNFIDLEADRNVELESDPVESTSESLRQIVEELEQNPEVPESTLHEHNRAYEIAEKMVTMPKDFREKVLENEEIVDITWLIWGTMIIRGR